MKDKIVVITGGAKGLGVVMAQLLIAKGNKVIICSRTKSEVERVAAEINATPFVADVSKEEDIVALKDFAVSTFGTLDVWINNAGIWSPKGVVEDTDINLWRQMFDINVFGTMYGSKAALLQMRRQNIGILVNIISSSALTAKPTFAGYAATKWAVRGFTDSIREEYRNTPIKIISVYPGGIKTNFFGGDALIDTSSYMTAEFVAHKIIENLEQEKPLEELVIRRAE